MKTYLLPLLAAALPWMGWIAAFRAVWLGAKMLFPEPGQDSAATGRGLGIAAFLAALGLGSSLLLGSGDPKSEAAYQFPLVWFVMPFSAWLAVASIVFGLVRLFQAWLALNDHERTERFRAAGLWTLSAILFIALYRNDPENKVTVLKGAIPISASFLLTFVGLAVAGTVAMVSAGRAARSRNIAKGIVNQVALVVGSIIFGLPFAFLLITSFKEDRDMSSPNGIVWIPKVQVTIPYMDPNDPLVEGEFKGQTVQGNIVERRTDGTVRVDIFKPLSIRGTTFEAQEKDLRQVPKEVPVVSASVGDVKGQGFVVTNLEDGRLKVRFTEPPSLKDHEKIFEPAQVEPVRKVGLRTANYGEALSYLPPETNFGLVYLRNTLILVIFNVIGTLLSSSLVAYAFSRLKFPGSGALFTVMMATMMLPGAVTLMPQFLVFRSLGWIDTLYPLWVPAFFGSAFNIFLLRQFFMGIPMELEDAAKIDGCSYLKTFWSIMMPQIKPALAVIAIWTVLGAWNNFMGPLIYVNSPEQMPLSYALQLFQGDRLGEPGLLMAFATLCMLPILVLFFFAQRYFIEGVTLSGLGGR